VVDTWLFRYSGNSLYEAAFGDVQLSEVIVVIGDGAF